MVPMFAPIYSLSQYDRSGGVPWWRFPTHFVVSLCRLHQRLAEGRKRFTHKVSLNPNTQGQRHFFTSCSVLRRTCTCTTNNLNTAHHTLAQPVRSSMSRRDTASMMGANNRGKPHRSRRRQRLRETKDEPFMVTFLKVGGTLMLLSSACYAVFLQQNLWDPTVTQEKHVDIIPSIEQQQAKINQLPRHEVEPFREERAWTDAYGIASEYQLDELLTPEDGSSTNRNSPLQAFAGMADLLRIKFAMLVGGEMQARAILQRGLLSFLPTEDKDLPAASEKPPVVTSPHGLAYRISSIFKSEKPIFSIAVLGSSAAAGSGNFFQQSYAFEVEKNLKAAFTSLNIQLQVRNLAIEDTHNEFPTVWCLDHYFPEGLPDVLVWDFGLTSTPESFESFLRTVAAPKAPFMMFRDTQTSNNNKQRNHLLQSYADANVIMDPLLVHVDQAAAPFLNQPEASRPEIFRQWTTSFGGPPGAPGKEHTHLSVKQHSMVGWLISMHILSALELVAANEGKNGQLLVDSSPMPTTVLPRPFVTPKKTQEQRQYDEKDGLAALLEQSTPLGLSLLNGQPKDHSNGKDIYHIPQKLQCRTTYLTNYTNDTLDSVILSGSLSGPRHPGPIQGDRKHLLEELLLPKVGTVKEHKQ